MLGMTDRVTKQRELVQEEENSSVCRTFSKQGLSGLKGDTLRNAVRHLKTPSHRSLSWTTTVNRERRRAQLRSRSRHVKCGDAAYVASNAGSALTRCTSGPDMPNNTGKNCWKTGRKLDGAIYSVPLMSCSVR